jgi:ABC-type sugar transport system substrate-binding protein
MKTVRIGILISSKFQINSEKMVLGIKTAHEELKDYKIHYDITVLNPLEDLYDAYCKTVDKYKNYDGVILSGMSSGDYTELINELYSVNHNVVQVQAVNRDAEYLFASKHDERVASALAAEFLWNCIKGSERKNVILFTGDIKSTLHADAAEAFKSSCESYGLKILASIDMNDKEEELEKIVPDVFKLYSDEIDGIYITSGLSTALCRYLDENGYGVPLVTFDTHEDIKKYMCKGIISATIAQNVVNQMKLAFELLVKHLISGTEFPKIVYTDVQLVLKSNIHQFD